MTDTTESQDASATTATAGDIPIAFVDSSAIVALVDRSDAVHQAAREAYEGLVAEGYRLFTTNHVLSEALDLLTNVVGAEAARQFLRDQRLPIYHVDEQDEQRAIALIASSRSTVGLTFADATSLIVMEKFGVADAFAVDPNFLSEAS